MNVGVRLVVSVSQCAEGLGSILETEVKTAVQPAARLAGALQALLLADSSVVAVPSVKTYSSSLATSGNGSSSIVRLRKKERRELNELK